MSPFVFSFSHLIIINQENPTINIKFSMYNLSFTYSSQIHQTPVTISLYINNCKEANNLLNKTFFHTAGRIPPILPFPPFFRGLFLFLKLFQIFHQRRHVCATFVKRPSIIFHVNAPGGTPFRFNTQKIILFSAIFVILRLLVTFPGVLPAHLDNHGNLVREIIPVISLPCFFLINPDRPRFIGIDKLLALVIVFQMGSSGWTGFTGSGSGGISSYSPSITVSW